MARRWKLVLAMVLVLASAPGGSSAWAKALNDTTQAAISLLERSLNTGPNGRGDALLRALRQMRDPSLKPLFAALASSKRDALRIHGILGLAELSRSRRIDLKRVAMIKDPSTLSKLISAAMDDKSLTRQQARQMLAWPGLKRSVKVLLAARLIGEGGVHDKAMLVAATHSKQLGERGLASLLLYQMNDPRGLKGLEALDRAGAAARRDPVRAMLLEIALERKLRRARKWAYALSTQPGVDPRLGMLAERVAMRFGSRMAEQHWRKQYLAAKDLVTKLRLAMMGLQLSPWLDARLFAPLAADKDALIGQIGRTARAIAAGKADAGDQVITLIQEQYPPADEWALHYAKDQGKSSRAQMIYLGLIAAYKQGPAPGRMQRLNTAVQAAQALYEQDPPKASRLLRRVLTNPKTDPLLVQGLLLALVRTQQPGAAKVIAGLKDFENLDAEDLAVLLRAKHGVKLDRDERQDLALLVEGGGSLSDTLRIQAAWCYLKQTGQVQLALKQVLRAH